MLRWRHQLNAMRAFEAVARNGSMTAAAAELSVTLGAVSQQVKALEASLGVPLFLRQHRRLELTEPGRRLSTSLRDSFADIERTLDAISRRPETRRLRLRVTPTFAIRWLVPRLTSFYQVHPELDIEVGTFQKQDDVRVEDADFIVRHGDGLWTDGVCDLLFRDSLLPACNKAIARTLREPGDLAGQTLLHSMMRADGWPGWLKAAGVPNLRPLRSIDLPNAAVSYQAAIDGLGVSLAQECYVREEIGNGRLVFPFRQVHYPATGYYLVCSRAKADQPNIRAFREWIGGLI
jgi:DNA-binding transcriptional LysR family regulator